MTAGDWIRLSGTIVNVLGFIAVLYAVVKLRNTLIEVNRKIDETSIKPWWSERPAKGAASVDRL